MLALDGSFGEGGGQILRTSLALSLVTGVPFRLDNIRAGRKSPGLLRQHLTAVQAAAEVGKAEVSGDALGSRTLMFRPGRVAGGAYSFSVGSAGSATLVLQTVLPPLCLAPERSTLTLEGGTHNPFAPPFDFLATTFLPLLGRMGPRVEAHLERPGFYPAGGGRFRVAVEPALRFEPLVLLERGPIQARRARALVSRLPLEIAERELKVAARKLGLQPHELAAEEVRASAGPGNVLFIELRSKPLAEIVTGFGERGVRAEAVASRAVKEAQRYLQAEVPVGEHLADQLLVPLALARGGSFRTLAPTEHTRTNAEVIGKFLPVEVRMEAEPSGTWRVEIVSR
jgi:RNA 3'-terminal phosphate cyclase (ATP)